MQLVCALCLALQAAVNTGDVDLAARWFAPDAVVIQPRIGGMPQVYIGNEQIRWWLTNLALQHASIELRGDPEVSRGHIRWSEALSADAFRQLGLDSVLLDADLVALDEDHIASLVLQLTPQAARQLAGSAD